MTITINIATLHIHIGDDPAREIATKLEISGDAADADRLMAGVIDYAERRSDKRAQTYESCEICQGPNPDAVAEDAHTEDRYAVHSRCVEAASKRTIDPAPAATTPWTLGITVRDGTIWAGPEDNDAERSAAAWKILADPLRELNAAFVEVSAKRIRRVVFSLRDELRAIGVEAVEIAGADEGLAVDLAE